MYKVGKVLIDLTQIFDALELGDTGVVRTILNACGDAIDQGAVVQLRREFEDLPPQVLAEFKSREELDNWKDKLNEVQKILKREGIN